MMNGIKIKHKKPKNGRQEVARLDLFHLKCYKYINYKGEIMRPLIRNYVLSALLIGSTAGVWAQSSTLTLNQVLTPEQQYRMTVRSALGLPVDDDTMNKEEQDLKAQVLIEDGLEPHETDKVFALTHGEWTVVLNTPRLLDSAQKAWTEALNDPVKIALIVQEQARKEGILSTSAEIHPELKRIEVFERQVLLAGNTRYLRFFKTLGGDVLMQNDLDASLRMAQTAARFNGDQLGIALNNPKEGSDTMELSISDQPAKDAKNSGGSVSFSTYGQRYSGRDVITGNYYKYLGFDSMVDFTYSKGLSELRTDSKGGYYDSYGISYTKVLERGILNVRYNHTKYKSGGELLPFDLRGVSDRLDVEYERPLSAHLSTLYGAGYIRQKTVIGALGMESTSAFSYGSVGVRYQKENFYGQVKVVQGLGGTRTFNQQPLGGEFDPTFTALQGEAKYTLTIDEKTRIELAGAAQMGTRGTPGPMQFYGGGLERGRSFNTGNIAGPSGVSGSITGVRDINERYSVYAGVDFARIKPNVGPAEKQTSAFIGIRGSNKKNMTYDLAITKGISGPRKDTAIMLFFNWRF